MVEILQNLIFMGLVNDCPILSGNMDTSITTGLTTPSQCEVVIMAPFYDMKKWKQTGAIIHTGESKKGKTDYAEWVNKLGGFATHNSSEHWVNRSIYSVVSAYANMIGAIVINELEL